MTTVAIRKKLVDYMKVADDKKVKAMYALLEDDIEQEGRIGIEQYNKEISPLPVFATISAVSPPLALRKPPTFAAAGLRYYLHSAASPFRRCRSSLPFPPLHGLMTNNELKTI